MRRPKLQEFFTTVAIATRDSLFCKMFSPSLIFCFEQEKVLKNFSKKLVPYTSKIKKKRRSRDEI